MPKYKIQEYKVVEKNSNPPNRKHLKALGYNWQRNQFDQQPQSIFGFLLGTLQRDQTGDDEQFNKLSSILYRQYKNEQKQIQETKDYLTNTMFLLGRKGFHQMENMPETIIKLRKKEEETKQLIPKLYNLINDVKTEEKEVSESPKKHKKEKKSKQAKEISSSHQAKGQKSRERSRSRDKKKKKYDASLSPQEKIKKKKDKHKKEKKKNRNDSEKKEQQRKQEKQRQKFEQKKQILKQQKQVTPEKKNMQTQEKSQPKAKTTDIIKQVKQQVKNSQQAAKKPRGRPKGSVHKAKILVGKFINPALSQSQQKEEQKEVEKQRSITKQHQERQQSPSEQELPIQEKVKKIKHKGRGRPSKKTGTEKVEDFAVQFDSD